MLNKKKMVLLKGVLATGLLCLGVGVSAAAYPDRPIKIVVNTGPGGLVDLSTRMIAEKMSENLGQPIVVENRPGGGGGLAARAVKNSRPDGYTLLSSAGTVAIQPAVRLDPGYQLNEFRGVGPTMRSALLMVTGGSSNHKTLQDFIERAKASPGTMSYASAGIGSTTHLGAALFLKAAGITLLHVPYNGNGPAMPDVMSGRVDMIFEAYGSGAPKVESGSLRALGVSASERLTGLPDVPTLGEEGAPGFSYYLWMGFLAPAGTPDSVVGRLSEALRYALESKELQERFKADGAEVMIMEPAEFDGFLKKEEEYLAKVVAELGIEKQ